MMIPFRKFALTTLCTGLVLIASAQITSLSPYSRYGLGDLGSSALAPNFAMGGFGTGFAERTTLNLQNAAAPAFIAKPVFDLAIRSSFLTLENSTASEKVHTTYINHFAYAFPITKRYTMSVGLIPLSRVGYNISDTYQVDDSTTVNLSYKGSGGLNKAFLGNAFDVINRKDSTILSVGLNINYVFGTLDKQRRAYYPQADAYYNTREVTTTTLKDFAFDLGALYSFYPNPAKSAKLTFGATYSFASSLRASQESLTQTFLNSTSGSEFPIDTIRYVKDDRGEVKLPWSIGLGASVLFSEKLMLGVDYSTQNWSSFSQTINNTEIRDNLGNSSRLSFGLQYTPKQTIVYNTSILKFFSYRLGARTETTYLQLHNTSVKGYAVSAGLGIPLRKSNSGSKINLGYEYARRGTVENQLIRESYNNFIIGISLSPSASDRWFYKRKYD
jgi:hypothetical protein